MPPRLALHEWSVVILFCSIIIVIVTLAIGKNTISVAESFHALEQSSGVSKIEIKGAVLHPGIYPLPPDGSLQSILEQVIPSSHADLSRLNRRRKLREGQVIHIPERVWITIYVEGAVKTPGAQKILSGSKWCEIVNQLELLPEANIYSIYKKKGYVNDGDLLVVKEKNKK